MKKILLAFVLLSGVAAQAKNPKSITCVFPETDIVAAQFDLVEGEKNIYAFRVSLSGGEELSERQNLMIVDTSNDSLFLQAGEDSDGDFLDLNLKTKQGYVGLIFPEATSFDFEVTCEIK